MESLLPRARVESEGGLRDMEEGTVGSLSAADEWAAMSHRIDTGPPPSPRARFTPRTAARLRDACLLACSIPNGPL